MRWWLVLIAVLVLSACQRAGETHRAEFAVFGTRVEVMLRGVNRGQAEVAFGQLGRDFQRMHKEWHPWHAGALDELNRGLAGGGWVRTTPDLVALIEASREMERRSAGHFNAAVGELVRLWGFHTSDYPITDPPPESESIEGWLARSPSAAQLVVDGDRVRDPDRSVHLDFSGIAKGYAARLACERLAGYRIHEALINLGGDVMSCGPADPSWRVGVYDPEGGVIGTLSLSGSEAVFTSGNYHRYGEWDGRRYAHILDPYTGYPVEEVIQVTVVHPDPVLADAAATALVVAGPGAWQDVAARLGLEQVLIVDAEGDRESTDAMAARLDQ